MLEILLVCAISVGIVLWFEIRAIRQQATIDALEAHARKVERALNAITIAMRSMTNTANMHNDTLETLVSEVDDLSKFARTFRALRDDAEIIQ